MKVSRRTKAVESARRSRLARNDKRVREILLTHRVHNEPIVTPENADAIRAVTAAQRDACRSIARTDEALGVRSDLLSPLPAGTAAAGGGGARGAQADHTPAGLHRLFTPGGNRCTS